MFAKFFSKMVIVILISGSLGKLKEVEKCLLETLKPSAPNFLYLADLKILTTAALEFQLLPQDLQVAMLQCFSSIQKGSCKEKYDTGNYEDCGIFIVPKCPPGYKRVDCSICAKECPQGSLPDAGGMLCQKPKILNRKQYPDMHTCMKRHQECENYGKVSVEKCAKGFVSLGIYMCILECPSDFSDQGVYCNPPTVISNDYCMNTFHEEVRSAK